MASSLIEKSARILLIRHRLGHIILLVSNRDNVRAEKSPMPTHWRPSELVTSGLVGQ